MAVAAGGNFVLADDIVDTVADEPGTSEDTSVGSAATNFTLQSATVRTLCGGKLIDFHLYITSDNAITATNGNVSDTTMFTLDAAYRPDEMRNAVIGDGYETGEAVVQTDGAVILRSMSDSISAGRNLRVNFVYTVT